MYIQLYNMLTSIIKKEGEYTHFDNDRWALQGKTIRTLQLLKDELRRKERGEVR